MRPFFPSSARRMKFIIKLFPEITIKSKPVRKLLIRQLRQNIKIIVGRIDPEAKVSGNWDYIDVSTHQDLSESANQQVIEALCCIPGIANFREVRQYPLGSFDDILEVAKQAYAEKLEGKTFCVRVKRSGNHDFRSIDVEKYVGGGLRQQTGAEGVKLKNPDLEVQMEIKNDQLFMIENRHEGLGGFPLGSQDTTVTLISGGFDSTVAAYLMLKRGIRTHFLFFNLGGRAHEIGVKQVSKFIWSKYGASHKVRFVTVPFEGVVDEILQKVDNSHMGVVLKRMMMRAAERVANKMEIDTFVTGEAIAQVSSQTMINLKLIDDVTDKLVLRPLIVTDKLDIINTARKIGTASFAETIPEYCGVISRKPTTRAKKERVEEEETNFNFDVLEQALKDATVQCITELDEEKALPKVEETSDASGKVVIDVRHPDEVEAKPFAPDGVEVIEIPFFSLKTRYPELDKSKQYLLYCDKGVMSKLHSMYLKEEGYDNVGVYSKKV